MGSRCWTNKPDHKTQRQKFEDAAHELKPDQSDAAFEAFVNKIAHAPKLTAEQIKEFARLQRKAATRIGAISLGRAIQFVANASVLGYDVRAAMVLYGEPGTPSLRVWDCEHLWAQYGGALVQPPEPGTGLGHAQAR